MNRFTRMLFLMLPAALCMLFAVAFTSDPQVQFSAAEVKRLLQHELGPVPADPTNKYADDRAAAHFGQFLFFERRLSSNGAISCATCHDPQNNFVDGAELATGLRTLNRHTMPLWNVAYNRWYFWDGRADTLWCQAIEPMEHEHEFGSNRLRVARTIHSSADLRGAYENIFGPLPDLNELARFPIDARPVRGDDTHPHAVAWNSMTADDQASINRVMANLGKAIAAYERKIISRDSPFDEFLAGLKANDRSKMGAISPAAQRGAKLFIGKANCRLCHTGPNFTDGEFHNNGIPPREGMAADAGRFDGASRVAGNPFNATGELSDERTGEVADHVKMLVNSPETWGQFKTPGLRNVAKTPPYMHQGQFDSLGEVIEFYSTLEGMVLVGHHQETLLTPAHLTEQEIEDLTAFLTSLTGKPLDADLLVQPQRPTTGGSAVAAP
jgi:cytochrome c peroxidase